jgi:hypothetical protein
MDYFNNALTAATQAAQALQDDGTLAAMVAGGSSILPSTNDSSSSLTMKSPDELRALCSKLVKLNKGS